MCLNALEIDPLRQWKGVWRWYDETMLDCCRPLEHIRKNGITLPEFDCLARCNGLATKFCRADMVAKETFLEDIKITCRSLTQYMVVSYSRQTLSQSGSGHFSPVGGYNEIENMVLILDVARFKYPSYWVSFDLLWEALFPIDSETKNPRGYVILSKSKKNGFPHAYSQLNVNVETWTFLRTNLEDLLPKNLASLNENSSLEDFCRVFLSAIPISFDSVVQNRAFLFTPCGSPNSATSPSSDEALTEYLNGLDNLLLKISETDLYALITKKSIQRRLLHSPQVSSESLNNQTDLSSNLRKSISDAMLPCNQVDDYSAFMTLFCYTYNQFMPFVRYLKCPLLQKVERLMDLDGLSSEIQGEIMLLLEQMKSMQSFQSSQCCQLNQQI
jgi:hypothetical protein